MAIFDLKGDYLIDFNQKGFIFDYIIFNLIGNGYIAWQYGFNT